MTYSPLIKLNTHLATIAFYKRHYTYEERVLGENKIATQIYKRLWKLADKKAMELKIERENGRTTN